MGVLGKKEANRKPAVHRTVVIGIRLTPKDANKLRVEAEAMGRTLAGHVVYLLRKGGAL